MLKSNRSLQIGLLFVVIAIIGFVFDNKSLGGFCLGIGGLVLIYAAFKEFWRWLEKRYE